MAFFGAVAFCVMVNGTTEKCQPPKVMRNEHETKEVCESFMTEYMPYYKRQMQKLMEQQSNVLLSDLKVTYQCLPATEAAKLPRSSV
jgi:polyribonucleotide nucleotidyltransferase